MNLAWSVLALALVGMDDSQPNKPQPPSFPFTIEFKIDGAQAQVPACQSVSSGTTATPAKSAKPVDASPCCSKADTQYGSPPMPSAKESKPRTINDPEAQEIWPMSLEQAIRIGLDNSEIVRVIAAGAQGIPVGGFEPPPLKTDECAVVASALGSCTRDDAQDAMLMGLMAGLPVVRQANCAPIVIARVQADESVWRFRAEVMAHVRSVEQQYWNLAQAHVQYWSAGQAVRLVQEILDREQAELLVGRGTIADVAEAAQRLEQFNLDLVTRTSDVITTERQFRNILGLPPSDNRRIIPVTPPVAQQIVFDWETCLHEMMEEQPDIAQQEIVTQVAQRQLLSARYQKAPKIRHPLANTRSAQYALLRARARQQQVIDQTTHSLARFFLEIDANYKQYRMATRLRSAAAERLDAQVAYYKEGRITVDRFCDAVSKFATAVATEHQYLTTYNISLAALSEAKGTLLADRNIVVAEGPRPAKSTRFVQTKTDDQTKTASFEPAKSEPAKSTSAEAKPSTWTFSISFGGASPVQINGTYTPGGLPKPAKTAE